MNGAGFFVGHEVTTVIDTGKALALADLLENAAQAIRELAKASREFSLKTDIPLYECEFSVRARKALTRLGCITLSDVCQLTRQQLLDTKHCGVTTTTEIVENLERRSMHLKNEVEK